MEEIGNFFKKIGSNFGDEKGAKWTAIIGTLLTALIGFFITGGMGGAIVGALGGALLSGPMNDLGEYAGNALGMSGTPAVTPSPKIDSPLTDRSVSLPGLNGKQNAAAIPVFKPELIPADVAPDAVSRMMSERDTLASSDTPAADRRLAKEEYEKYQASASTLLSSMDDYLKKQKAYEDKGRASTIAAIESGFTTAPTAEEKRLLDNLVPHLPGITPAMEEKHKKLVGKLPEIAGYNVPEMIKALNGGEHIVSSSSGLLGFVTMATSVIHRTGTAESAGTYGKSTDMEAVASRAWARDYSGKDAPKWEEQNPLVKAQFAQAELEKQQGNIKAPDWDKLEGLMGDPGLLRNVGASLSLSTPFSKQDVAQMKNLTPEKMVLTAAAIYSNSGENEKALHTELEKVMRYANAQAQIDQMETHIKTNVGEVVKDYSELSKTVAANKDAIDRFNVIMDGAAKDGVIVIAHGEKELKELKEKRAYVTAIDMKKASPEGRIATLVAQPNNTVGVVNGTAEEYKESAWFRDANLGAYIPDAKATPALFAGDSGQIRVALDKRAANEALAKVTPPDIASHGTTLDTGFKPGTPTLAGTTPAKPATPAAGASPAGSQDEAAAR